MNDLKKEIERPEIFNAIRNSIPDARYSARKLAEAFTENIKPLRMEESEHMFVNLSQNIQELDYFLDFITQLREGMRYFDGFSLPADPISSEGAGLSLFQEMHAALESKDWIMLSDLIEYELSPLLLKQEQWLGSLYEKILEYDA
ncbi:MAG TPA: hypothetical protein DDX85_11425 [Nitrospiraceae bacterium]|jgi:hypothetical protein|nr:hypothetical protein [Nitrospiraceae bacterium]